MVGNFLSRFLNRAVCEDLAEHLSRRGWYVITVSHRLNAVLRLVDMLTTIWLRRHEYQVAQIDVFSGRAFIWAEIAGGMLHFLRKPFALTLHGGNLPVFASKNPDRVRRLLNSAIAVTAPSPYMQREMAAYRANIQIIPNALDLSRYPYRHREVVKSRLIWLRSLAPEYNPIKALEVVSMLRVDIPDIQLKMIGPVRDGTLHADMLRYLEEHELANHVQLVGGIPHADVPRWLEQADIFINTTTIDNTPVSILEALACGLCVVTTNVGGIPFLLKDERDALLVPTSDSQAMATAVRRCLYEPNLAATLSQGGRRLTAGLDWSVILPQWETLLLSLSDACSGQR